MEKSARWCDKNHLQVNTGKTRVGGGFPAQKDPNTHVNINGERVEMVDTCKFLGVHLNNKLDWSDNTDAPNRQGQSQLFSLSRLSSFNVCTRLLWMFHQSVVASVIVFAVLCWGGGAGAVAQTN